MDRVIGVDCDEDPRLGNGEFAHPAEREPHFGQGLVRAPRVRDDGDLVLPALRALVPGGPYGLDAFARRVVHGGAHVLVGLAAERQVRKVEDGLLGHLHDRPTRVLRGQRELLVDGIEGGGQARGESKLGELGDRGASFPRRVREVRHGQGNAARTPVGPAGVPGGGEPHEVALPRAHPPQGARSMGAHERGQFLGRARARNART